MITCPNMSRHMPRGMCGSRRHSVVKFCISKLIKITQLSRTCACARAVTRGRAFRGTPCSISLPHTTPTVEPCLHTPGLPIPSRNIAARAHPPYNQKYTCVPKNRGWDMPRMRRGVGLRSCRHGEWHGPCSLRPKDSVSNSPSRRTSCPRRPASSTVSIASARLQRRK